MAAPLDPTFIPKFVTQLVIPPVYKPVVVTDPVSGKVISHHYQVSITEFKQQILPPNFPETTVWGYEGIINIREEMG